MEVIWNHLLRFRGEIASRTIAQAAPTRGGKYTLVQFSDEFYLLYSMEGMTEADLNNKILLFKQRSPRRQGSPAASSWSTRP